MKFFRMVLLLYMSGMFWLTYKHDATIDFWDVAGIFFFSCTSALGIGEMVELAKPIIKSIWRKLLQTIK